ncbi:MAG: hypothetical protein VB071_14400 [Lawsonibacter sp.]|nr:hypothetical protein [Lawsonibacter sp.]
MFKWIGDALSGAVSVIGEGLSKVLSWLISGLLSVISKILSAFGGIFDLLDALWGFFVGIKDAILNLLSAFFPWIPPEVVTVISLGLFAVLLAGIIKKVRGK